MADDRNFGLQALRAVAALSVVYDHVIGGSDGLFFTIGVDVFFVISGFIMGGLVESSGNGVVAALRFVGQRVNRLLPVYLLVVTLWSGFLWSVHASSSDGFPVTLHSYIGALLPIPYCTGGFENGMPICNPILRVAWTLSYEFVFYGLCALAIWRGLKGPWLIGLVIAALVVLSAADGLTGGTVLPLHFYIYPSPTNSMFLLFAAGLMLNLLLPRLVPYARLVAPVALVSALGLAVYLQGAKELAHGSFGWDALSVLAVTGFLLAGRLVDFRVWGLAPLVWLGDRSYGLYLVHVSLLGIIRCLFSPTAIVLLPLTTGISIVVAAVLYEHLERPANRRLNALLDRWLAQA